MYRVRQEWQRYPCLWRVQKVGADCKIRAFATGFTKDRFLYPTSHTGQTEFHPDQSPPSASPYTERPGPRFRCIWVDRLLYSIFIHV